MKSLKAASYAAAAALANACMTLNVNALALPDTGNTEKNTYVIVLAVAGVLVIAAAAVGILTKKKK